MGTRERGAGENVSDHFAIQYREDSFALLRGLPNSVADVVITDPPFNEHVQKNMISGTAMKKHVTGGSGGIPHVEMAFDPLAGYEFARDLVRAAKRWVISFCAVEDFGAYRDSVGGQGGEGSWVRGGIWFKPNAQGQMTGDRPAACYEGLAIMHRPGKKEWQGRGSYGLWSADSEEFPSTEAYFQCNGTRGEKERHPNQKPLRLLLELVAKFTRRGEIVLDPFCGSGRVGEACMLLGRRYVGFDLSPGEKTRGVDWVMRARGRVGLAAERFGSVEDSACLRLCSATGERGEMPAGAVV